MRAAFLSTCLAILGVASALAESVSLTPVKDNTIIQWSPSSPDPNPLWSNALGDLFVGRTNQDGHQPATTSIRRGLIHFNVAASIPAGATINRATLTMRLDRGLNGDPTVKLHRVLQDWGEGTSFFDGGQDAAASDGDVTWLHTFYEAEEPEDSPTWDQPGGDYHPTPSAVSMIVRDLGEGQVVYWTSIEMAADAQWWLDEPSENFGWILLGDETVGQSAKRFNSRESRELPDVPPVLTIEFEPILAGDYNDDDRVDVADYIVWRRNLDTMTTLKNEAATPGRVTSEDYDVWKSNFGAGSAQTESVASVPEPHFATMFLAAVFHLSSLARSRGRCFA